MSVIPKPAVSPLPLPRPAPAPRAGADSALAAITGAIQQAADATGASFGYLLATAKVESNLNPNVRSASSSATGLFQFIEQTWLGMLKQTGQALGFGGYADAITQTSDGQYRVSDAKLRHEILQLRRDPGANATLAGAFTQQNAAILGQRLGRPPTEGELYVAHVLGTSGAAQLIVAARDTPQANAAAMFPGAARANRALFYDRHGQARSVAGLHAELDRRYRVARANVAAVVATVPPGPPAPDTAGTARAFADAARPPVSTAPPKPDFRSLFHTDMRGPVAPVVSELWGAPARVPANAATGVDARAGSPFDLFQDMRPDARSLFNGGRS
jgi:hypothetical protein